MARPKKQQFTRTMNRALGYRRVSTGEQAVSGAGIEAQGTTIDSQCNAREWILVDTITDAGFSAKDLDRPGIQEVLRRLRDGEADILVVAKLDRLSRSMLDFATLMETAKAEGWKIVALDLGMDTSTPAGEMMANVLATFAQFERRLIGQRTKDALAVKKAQGVHIGRRSTLDLATTSMITNMAAAGMNKSEIARSLEADGVATGQGGKWYPATVGKILARQEVAA